MTVYGGNGTQEPLITEPASSSDGRATGKSGVMPAKYLKVAGSIPVSHAVSASFLR